MDSKVPMRCSVVSGTDGCALRGLENMITLTFQRYILLDTKDSRLLSRELQA